MRCAPTTSAATAAALVNTRTIDELAAGGVRFDQAISAAPWTAPSTTSIVTGLYAHHHGYLHWDAQLDPTIETLLRAFAAHGYEVASFVFDTNYLFKDLPEANVLGTSESLDGAFEWMRANRDRRSSCTSTTGRRTCRTTSVHADRKDWLAAKQEVIAGIQSDSASALEAMREAYRKAVERQSEELVASFLEELETLGLRESTVLAFLSDHGESWGERFAAKEDVKGVYHMHGATVYDEIVEVPLVLSAPGTIEPGVVESQVRSIDLMPTLLELAGLPARESDGESLLPLTDGATRRSRSGDRRHRHGRADEARGPQTAVEADPPRRERGGGGVQPRARSARAESRRTEAPPELREIVFRELESAERPRAHRRRRRRPSRSGSPTSGISSDLARDLLRADVLHPPLRGDPPRPLLPREARRDDPHLHRAGGERGRPHRSPGPPPSTRSSRTTAATGTTSRSRTTRSACCAR